MFVDRIAALLLSLCVGFSASAHIEEKSLNEDVLNFLATMRAVYGSQYAPAEWKKSFAGYDLEENYQNAVGRTKAKADLNQADSRKILRDFVYAMKDYHVSISFFATESASLPFSIRGADGKYFLVYIDRNKLPEDSFPLQIGDEVIEFGGVPVAQAVAELKSATIENVDVTDQARAELSLTSRSASRGLAVPQGPITVTFKPQGSSETVTQQLIWDYKPELVAPRKQSMGMELAGGQTPRLLRPMMNVDVGLEAEVGNPFLLGARKSFTPALGQKLWESAPDAQFDAYIFMTPERKLVGYVRIPGYVVDDYVSAVDEFAALMARFERNTDALIIDQVNNPGGSVFYLYALASHLSAKPLVTPLHRMSIVQADVLEAQNLLALLKTIKSDADVKKLFTREDMAGFQVNYQVAQFFKSYAQFIVDEWNAGRTLSQPYWIGGVNHINPAAQPYTKPILVLVNELDFSGGDFFPTILQDNKRATIMGTRTAGAGGYVLEVDVPNNLGVASFRFTGSIAERVNGQPIENLGVTPDVGYSMTGDDYTQNFSPYVAEILKNINQLMK